MLGGWATCYEGIHCWGGIAQLAERPLRMRKVGSSNLPTSIISSFAFFLKGSTLTLAPLAKGNLFSGSPQSSNESDPSQTFTFHERRHSR